MKHSNRTPAAWSAMKVATEIRTRDTGELGAAAGVLIKYVDRAPLTPGVPPEA